MLLSLLRSSGRGRRRMQRSEFLSFEEARSYMRSLRLGSHKAYRLWRDASRPPNIPYHPDRMYKDSWSSNSDYLGYTWSSAMRRARSQKPADVDLRKRAAHETHHLAVRDFVAGVQGVCAGQGFSFAHLPDGQKATVLYQLSEGSSSVDDWIPLQLKALRRDNCSFQSITTFLGAGVICISSGTRYFAALRSELNPVGVSRCVTFPNESLPSGGEVQSLSAVGGLLKKWWNSHPRLRRPYELLVTELAGESNRARVNELKFQAIRRLYDPLALKCMTPSPGSLPMVDAFVNGYLFVHRVASKKCRRRSGTALGLLVSRNCGSTKVPFKVSDRFDFLVVLVPGESRSQVLAGVFVFPKDLLFRYMDGEAEHERGVYHMSVYPPFVAPAYRCSKERQHAQLQYYIDLQGSADPFAEQDRFLRILRGEHRSPATDPKI